MIKKFTVLILVLLGLSLPVYAKKITVYPNPWIPESGKSLTSNNDKMRHGAYTSDGWIKFKGVNESNDPDSHGDLRIYDITDYDEDEEK